MSDTCIYLKVEPYLAEWMKASHGNPVQMVKDSPESRLVKLFLEKQPIDIPIDNPNDFNIAIEIPWYKEKDPRVYFYLTERSKAMIAECYQTLFVQNMWRELGQLQECNCSLTAIIYAWLDKHGISEEHWETIRQKYYRMRKRYALEKNIKL